MIERESFFSYVRKNLFDGVFSKSQVDGLTTILDGWDADWSASDPRWLAYELATTHHETNKTMQPVREAYWLKDPDAYVKAHHSDYYPYYGRGYVQLTWLRNYILAGEKIGVDLMGGPELAMIPENAAKIMFYGMAEGWFTGKKLSDYINAGQCDWVNARRIINGTDKAGLVASYAEKYNAAIIAALMPDFGDVKSGVV